MMKKQVTKKMVTRGYIDFKSDAGGLKEVIASIKGKNIYSFLKYESGVHQFKSSRQ